MTENRLKTLYYAEKTRLIAFNSKDGDFLHPVFGEGNLSADALFVGEAPGKDEAEKGRPFVGKAGAQLDRMLSLAGIERSSIYITNTVKFRPYVITEKNGRKTYRNRKPSKQEIKDGAALLAKEIECVSPKIIITLGNTPLSAAELIFGKSFGTVGEVHGKEILLTEDIVLVPLYHPASGIYRRELVKVMEDDLRKLGIILKADRRQNT